MTVPNLTKPAQDEGVALPRDSRSDRFTPSDGTVLQNSGSVTMTAERFTPHAARPSDLQPKGGIASLSPADRAAVAARAAAALMQRANAACDAPMSRGMTRTKDAAGGAQHDWASADWIAESMADTVDSFCLDSAMGPMDGDGYNFQSGHEVSGFGAGWMSGEGSYAHGSAPITAADFGDVGGAFASPFGSLHGGDSFAVPDITAAAGPADRAYGGLPTSFLADTRFPMPMAPDLPLAYGGLPAAAAAHPGSALRSNSCSDPAHVPSLMVVNVPMGSYGGSDAATDEPVSDDGTGSPDGRSQRLAARAQRAARRAAADGDGGLAEGDDGTRAEKHDAGSNASSEYVPDSDDGDSAGGSSHLSGSTAAVASRAPPSAVYLMPAIGAPRPPVKGRHPTDAELKQQIAALQTRAALSYNPDRSTAAAARCECLMRYREKKLRRLDSNTIRYMKRKINADKRPRIKGRFVKAEELHLYSQGLLPGQNGIKPDAAAAMDAAESGDK